MHKNSKPNPAEVLNNAVTPDNINWVTENTAMLIVHGIGNQLPIETIDHFARGFVKRYRKAYGEDISLSHEVVTKTGDNGVWFDNVLRIHYEGSKHFIDIYEYYWANYTEDKASWSDLNKWLQGVVNGAEKFYKRNGQIGKQYKDKSPFFDTRTGDFKVGIYRLFISVVSKIFLAVDLLWRLIIWLVSLIPFLGKLADSMLQSYADGVVHDLTNILADVAVYNVVDPKSKFYDVRRRIQDGAVKALTYLIERPAYSGFDIKEFTNKCKENKLYKNKREQDELDQEFERELKKQELYYPSVIIAGHSLGSQVAYDAINKLNLLVNMGGLLNYNENGKCKFKNGNAIENQLRGFITFGCPLDKIVFFLRENAPDDEYLRQQILDNYHGFKQRPLDFDNNEQTNKQYVEVSCGLKKVLDNIPWRNYYDNKDYVSGGLDYYTGLTNIDCRFKAGTFGFTHGNYWNCDGFYADIIYHYLT